jgi:pyrimidine operon attenuation protein / uracil phosphoribosyltransferase
MGERDKVVLQGAAVTDALTRIVDAMLAMNGDGPWGVVGIRRGGDHLAKRIADLFAARTGTKPPLGVVDITLYRDDGFGPHQFPQVGVTEIPFDVKSRTIVLVDDVLYTGRTVRAAIDVILDYGRPKAVRLATLVDRGLHELPIRADAVGLALQTQPHEHVDVQLTEAGAQEDAVVVSIRGPV